MTKETAIKRLESTLMRLMSLNEDSFYYATYVNQFAGECGTVCCVAGWYPEWFPESGFKWFRSVNEWIEVTLIHESMSGTERIFERHDIIQAHLSVWHGLPLEEIDYLFYGGATIDRPGFGSDDNLRTVISRFQYVIEGLKNDTIQISTN